MLLDWHIFFTFTDLIKEVNLCELIFSTGLILVQSRSHRFYPQCHNVSYCTICVLLKFNGALNSHANLKLPSQRLTNLLEYQISRGET